MYRLFILCLFLVGGLSLSSWANPGTVVISGKVIDSLSQKSIPFVTVTVQNSKSKVIKRLASDANGAFSFSISDDVNGEVVVSSIGYKPQTLKFESGSKKKKDLGTIYLSEESAKLGTVVVQAQKQLVKVEVDKLSYNTEADPESQTLTALDMLRKVPLLTVDGEDNVKLKGTSNFKILINGKESSLMANNPKDVLKGMPASSIKNVEVITNPSSKYSAEGVGGIINIVTTKKSLEGLMGSVGVRGDSQGSIGGNFYTTAKIGKLSFSVNYGPNYWKEKKGRGVSIMENYLSTTDRRTESYSNPDGHAVGQFGMGEMSYEIDSLNLLSLSFMGFGGTSYGKNNSLTTIFDDKGGISKKYNHLNDTKSTHGSLSGNLDYQRSFKTPDKLFTVSYKFERTPNDATNENTTSGIVNAKNEKNKSVNKAASYEHTFQVDFVNPFTQKHQLEVGAKYILRTNPSETNFYDFVNNDWKANVDKYNDLDYTQNIVAGYLGYLLKLEKVSFKTGCRLEGAYTDASSMQGLKKTTFDNNVTNVVPYVTVAYMFSPMSSLKLNYTQRLQRPGIWYLNPYIDDSRPQSISYGNPNLETEKVHAVELTYSYYADKGNIEMSAFSRFNDNSIQSITSMRADGIKVETFENSGKNNSYGASLYGSWRPFSKLSIDLDCNTMYSVLERNNGITGKEKNDGWENGFSGTIRWNVLPKLSLNSSGGYWSNSVMLQGRSSGYHYYAFSVRQKLLKDKLDLSLSIMNPFEKNVTYKTDLSDATFMSHREGWYESRRVSFGITYRFGKMGAMVKKAQRGINNDDMKSGGGSNNGGGSPK